MKRLHRLKKNEEFSQVFRHGKSLADRNLVLYYVQTEPNQPYQVGISVGKKIGKAVVRNRIKRLIREVVRTNGNHIPNGLRMVLIARQGILNEDFQGIEKSFIKLMKKASLWLEDSVV